MKKRINSIFNVMLIHTAPLFLPAIYFLLGIFSYLFFLKMLLILPLFIVWSSRYSPYLLLLFGAGIGFGFFQLQYPKSTVNGLATIKVLKIDKGKWGGHQVKGLLTMTDKNQTTIAKNILLIFQMKSLDPNTSKIVGDATLSYIDKRYQVQLHCYQSLQKTSGAGDFFKKVKSYLSKQIEKAFPSNHPKAFFKATFLGIKAPDHLYFHFKKTGLLHILAISGFHFGLICFCIHVLFKKLLSSSHLAILQIILMSFYFLLLDSSFSINRAYILILTFYTGLLLCKKSNLVNSLCFAFFIEVFLCPSSILQMGMQLSYLITFCLVNFYPTISKFFTKSIPEDLIGIDRIYGLILKYFAKASSICICVNIVAMPILLFHFKEFGVFSILYNLIMPQLFAICMMAALFSLPFSFLSNKVDWITKNILQWIEYTPNTLDYTLHFAMPEMLLSVLLSSIYFTFLHQQKMIRGPKTAYLLHSLS